MECPDKVKVFSWRLIHNSLPLKRKIEAKGIELDTRCPVCWRAYEDASHLLFRCKFSKLVWRELQLDHKRLLLADLPSPKEVFHHIWACTNELQVKLITLMWVLTSERNAVNAGEKLKSPSQVANQIQRYYLEFRDFFKRTDMNYADQKRWTKPHQEFMKINVDASFIEEEKRGGWGFVARNEAGEIECAGAGKIVVVSSPFQAEAIACLHALKCVAEQGIMTIELETDCLNLKNALRSDEWDAAPKGMLIGEINFFLRSPFNSAIPLFAPRSCNAVAHRLAQFGVELQNGSSTCWLENFPAFVTDLVASDVSLSSGQWKRNSSFKYIYVCVLEYY
jgi:hypothetical protein